MKKINVLRICYWCLLLISSFMLAIVFPKWTFKDFIMPIIILLCAIGAGYVDRMIDEKKEKYAIGFGDGYECCANGLLRELEDIQEEPVSNPTPNKKMSVERWKKACEAACCDINYRSHYGLTETRDDYFVDGVQWADEHPKEEPVSEELGEYINELSKQFPEVSFAKLSRIAVRVAKCQKEQIKKTMDLGEPPYLISVEQAYYRTLKLLEE